MGRFLLVFGARVPRFLLYLGVLLKLSQTSNGKKGYLSYTEMDLFKVEKGWEPTHQVTSVRSNHCLLFFLNRV